jgi:hypothetical protein
MIDVAWVAKTADFLYSNSKSRVCEIPKALYTYYLTLAQQDSFLDNIQIKQFSLCIIIQFIVVDLDKICNNKIKFDL